jgi:hypothetical protein
VVESCHSKYLSRFFDYLLNFCPYPADYSEVAN